jgi:hypothetical protein
MGLERKGQAGGSFASVAAVQGLCLGDEKLSVDWAGLDHKQAFGPELQSGLSCISLAQNGTT